MKWTSEQSAFIDAIANDSGNVAGMALAGSGKTATGKEGIMGYAQANPSKRIIYLCFNAKNRDEAKEKIVAPNVDVMTFNQRGLRTVLKHWRGIRTFAGEGYMRCKALAGEKPNRQLLTLASQLMGASQNRFINPSWQDMMTLANNLGIQPTNGQGYEIDDIVNLAHKALQMATEYPRSKQISFDDQVWLPTRLNLYEAEYDMGVMDESQDANILNFDMMRKIVKPDGRIVIIGDENQQMYGFRGSVRNGMTDFCHKIGAVKYPLTINFRCGSSIIAKAQEIVPEIQAHESNGEGLVESCNQDKMLIDVQVKEAILSRTNAPLVGTCLNLTRRNKPAYIEGKDIAKTLIDIIDNLDTVDINEIPAKIDLWLQIRVAKATGWDATRQVETWTDTAETLKVLALDASSIDEMKKKIESMFFDSDYVRVPSIILSTVHKAKGREFPSVYILEKSFATRGNMVRDDYAEKCVRYVALTRAKQKLVLVS